MATKVITPHLITAEQFFAIRWDDPDTKAELDRGVIRMMAGGSFAHSRVQRNILVALDRALEGGDCSPHGPDMAVRTTDISVRYPDISVFCGHLGPDEDAATNFTDPRAVVEVLSPSTRDTDLREKLVEYRALPSLGHIMFVDPDLQAVRVLTRIDSRSWNDEEIEPGQDVVLSRLDVRLAWQDIFARR